MSASEIDVSHIVSVYNRHDLLPDTVAGLLAQTGPLRREFIFVDDNSPDTSVAVLKELAAGRDDIRILENRDNRGPSVRLNQGARAARGRVLHFLDHDDIVPANAVRIMREALVTHTADLAYGRWEKTGVPARDLIGRTVPEPVSAAISDDPLRTILKGRYRRMCLLVTRETYLAAGGADENVFIQDESMPLRLARVARRLVTLDAVVNLVPRTEGNLSENRSQLNHDRFLAHYDMLRDFPDLPRDIRATIARKALSAGWKEKRLRDGAKAFLAPVLWAYLGNDMVRGMPDMGRLEALAAWFAALPGVRRAQPAGAAA